MVEDSEIERADVLSKAQISLLNKNDLVKYANNLSKAYNKLFDRLFNDKTGVIPMMESQIAVIKSINDTLVKKLILVERTSNGNAQYARKETIEFHGFNPDTSVKEVEGKVLNIINSITTNDNDNTTEIYTPQDIQACHKLKDKTKIICKFVSRKRMRNVVNNRKKLKGMDLSTHGIPGKLFINESMAPAYKQIDWKCRQLKKAKMIKDCWFFNGNYTLQTLDDKKNKISHTADILELLNIQEEDLDTVCNKWKDKKNQPVDI